MYATLVLVQGNGARVLERLQAHPVFSRTLPGRGPVSYRERAELGEEMTRRLEGAGAALRALPEWKTAVDLIADLGLLRYAPAAPTLAALAEKCPVMPIRNAAGHALFAIGTAEAHAALQLGLERAEHLATFLALKSLVTTAATRCYDRLGMFLSDVALDAPGGAELASEILRFFQTTPKPQLPDSQWAAKLPDLIRADRRWVRRVLELRRDARVAGTARHFLRLLTRDEVEAALGEWPDPAPRPREPYRGPTNFVARYRAGDHAAAWGDLRAVGPIHSGCLLDEAMELASLTMERVRRNVERITERLRAAGYQFADERAAWVPPSFDVQSVVRQLEMVTGARCPLVLEAFWRVVGSVDWRLDVDADLGEVPWGDYALGEADPLCIDGPSLARTIATAARELQEDVHPAVADPPEIELAADYLHKADISGGPPYAIVLPAPSEDPVLEYEQHLLPFSDYLRLCFRWGGFSRLGDVPRPPALERFLATLRHDLEPF